MVASPLLDRLSAGQRADLLAALALWLDRKMQALAPLRRLEEASRAAASGGALRALLIRLVEAGGMLAREGAGLDQLDKPQRDALRKLGVKVGTLDIFHPAMLRAKALLQWQQLRSVAGEIASPMDAVLPERAGALPLGYRRLGAQAIRLDRAEDLLRAAHQRRAESGGRAFYLDPQAAVRLRLSTRAYAQLLRMGGFRPIMPRDLPQEAFGPLAPVLWRWQPPKRDMAAPQPTIAKVLLNNPFAALAPLVA